MVKCCIRLVAVVHTLWGLLPTFLCERVSFACAPGLHPVCAQFCTLLCCVFSGESLQVDRAKLQQINQKILRRINQRLQVDAKHGGVVERHLQQISFGARTDGNKDFRTRG